MRPSVGQNDAVMIFEQPLSVPIHPEPIVAYPVEQDNHIPIPFDRTEKPCAEHHAIFCAYAYVTKLGLMQAYVRSDLVLVGRRDWPAPRVGCDPPQSDSAQKRTNRIKDREQNAGSMKERLARDAR